MCAEQEERRREKNLLGIVDLNKIRQIDVCFKPPLKRHFRWSGVHFTGNVNNLVDVHAVQLSVSFQKMKREKQKKQS